MKTSALILASALFATATARAASIDAEFSAGSGSWNDAGNWTPSGVPDNGGGDTFDVTLPDASTINALTSDITVQNLTTGGTVTFNSGIDNRVLTVVDSFTHASGTLTIQGSMGLVLQGSSTFSGGLAVSNGGGVLNQGALVFGSGPLPTLDFVPVTTTFAPNLYDFRNEGAVSFTPGADVALASADIQNTGRATIATGGSDALLSTYTQSEASGERTTIVAAGSTLHANTVTITSGNLYGNGTVNGSASSSERAPPERSFPPAKARGRPAP